MFYDEAMKKKAKRVNFIEYLKKYHPDAVQWKLSGYVYKKQPWVAVSRAAMVNTDTMTTSRQNMLGLRIVVMG